MQTCVRPPCICCNPDPSNSCILQNETEALMEVQLLPKVCYCSQYSDLVQVCNARNRLCAYMSSLTTHDAGDMHTIPSVQRYYWSQRTSNQPIRISNDSQTGSYRHCFYPGVEEGKAKEEFYYMKEYQLIRREEYKHYQGC